MLRIDLINVQAIEEAHIYMEDNTITEFVGNNSNGKSIVAKVIEYITKGDLIHNDVRQALMKDGSEQSVILFTYGNKQLGVVLKPAVKECVMMYIPDMGKEKQPGGVIMRSIGDSDGCAHLVKAFGFRTYAKGDICLQLAPTFGAIPFVTTSGAVNNDIVTDITKDKVADEFLRSFETITFPVFKDRLKRLKQEREQLQQVVDNMESYDWHAYDELANEMKDVYLAIGPFVDAEIDHLQIPSLNVAIIHDVTISKFPVIDFCDYPPELDDVSQELKDYLDVLNGICPTCGKPLF